MDRHNCDRRHAGGCAAGVSICANTEIASDRVVKTNCANCNAGQISCDVAIREPQLRQGECIFCAGIQDEIITTLSRISGLRVISRTSTARYNSAPENLPEIASQLRVSNVLEGSVQKAGDRVHINVQLIQADNDAHLWAQSYDRQLTDIFSVEAEVAKSIADSLQATLSPQEKARVEAKPTTNADAYVL